MKAGILFAEQDIRYADMPLPEVTPGSVRIRVKSCGICGSDIPRVLQGTAHFFPIVLGHEFSGIVDAVGEGTEGFCAGDHVSAIPLVPCMECEDCKNGNYALCKHYSFIGTRQQGGMAEYVVVPQQNVLKIDPSIPFAHAAMFEPCTVALHAILHSGFDPDRRYAVLGGGTIGIFALQWLKALGAKHVTVVGRNKDRLRLSLESGADEIVSVLDADHRDRLLEITEGRGFDGIFEVAGSTQAMQLAFEIAANKAKLCFIGTPKENLVFTPKLWENMNRKEFDLTGSWMSFSAPFPGKEWTMTADYFAKGLLRVTDGMIFREYPLSEIREAFDLFRDPRQVKGKVLICNP